MRQSALHGHSRGASRCRAAVLSVLAAACSLFSLASAQDACDCTTDFSCVLPVSDAQGLRDAIARQCISIKILQHLDLGSEPIVFPAGTESIIIWGECGRDRPATESFLPASPNDLAVDQRYPCGLHSSCGNSDFFTIPTGRFIFFSNLVFHTNPPKISDRTRNAINLNDGELWMANTILGGFTAASILAQNSNVYLLNTASYQVGDFKPGSAEAGLNFLVNSDSRKKLFLRDTVFHTDNLQGYSPVFVGAENKVPGTGYSDGGAFFRQEPLVVITGQKMFFHAHVSFKPGCLGLCVGYSGTSQPDLYLDPVQAAGNPTGQGELEIKPTFNWASGGTLQLQDFANITWQDIKSDAFGDLWISNVNRLVIPGANLAAGPPANIALAPAPKKSKDSTWKTWYTIVIAALAVLLIVCIIGGLMYRRGRKQAEKAAQDEHRTMKMAAVPAATTPWSESNYSNQYISPLSKAYVPSGPYDTGFSSDGRVNVQSRPFNAKHPSHMLPPDQRSYDSSHSGSASMGGVPLYRPQVNAYASTRSTVDSGLTALGMHTYAEETSGAPATVNVKGGKRNYKEELALLERMLDAVDQHQNGLFLKRFHLLGPSERRAGGQGMVQFADMVYNAKRKVAIKFFLSRVAFNVEQSHYANPALQRVLPPVDDVVGNEDGSCRDPYGRPFPPLVVVEKGESLDEWSRRMQQADFASRMHIIIHLVERVKMLHDCGLVHRDLKPSNTIYLNSRNEWTLIDFGSAAAIGATVPLSMSVAYAAPEVVLAFEERLPGMEVRPSVDVWALGVMSFELLTGTRVFDARGDPSVITNTMRGELKLPWEGETPEALHHVRKLGFMGSQILRMLDRNPDSRASLKSVYSTWKHMLQAETSTAMPSSEFVELAPGS